jgi:hypothetical protein
MSKTYPNYQTPTMIYNQQNQFTIIDAADVEAFVAAGWSTAPSGDIHTAPTEFPGEVALPDGAPPPVILDDLSTMTQAQLLAYAGNMGLELSPKLSKAKIIDAIQAAQAN